MCCAVVVPHTSTSIMLAWLHRFTLHSSGVPNTHAVLSSAATTVQLPPIMHPSNMYKYQRAAGQAHMGTQARVMDN
jgi:hypothetical protein